MICYAYIQGTRGRWDKGSFISYLQLSLTPIPPGLSGGEKYWCYLRYDGSCVFLIQYHLSEFLERSSTQTVRSGLKCAPKPYVQHPPSALQMSLHLERASEEVTGWKWVRRAGSSYVN